MLQEEDSPIETKEQSLEELLEASVKAAKEAPNRSVKRRLRQRLHKKLGAMLSQEQYEEALSRLRSMEESSSGSEAAVSCSQPMAHRRNSEPAGLKGIENWKPSMAMNPVKHAQSIKDQVAPKDPAPKDPGQSMPASAQGPPGGYLGSMPGTWSDMDITPPVQRTFIHYNDVDADVSLSNRPSRIRSSSV